MGNSAVMGDTMAGYFTRLREFAASRRGNVAMMFGLALVPLTIAGGVGLDLARGMMVRSAMSDALDAAGLAVGSTTGLDHDSALALAKQYFDANYKGDAAYGTPTLSIADNGFDANGSVTITATDPMPTTLMKIAGFQTIPVSTTTTVVWGQSKLWVALVLDNSGSMAQGDSNGSKMDALKSASKQLLTTLQNASANAGDVQVSIVPFDRVVNVGTSNVNASWVGWTPWEAQPANVDLDGKTDLIGPGDACPFTNSSNQRISPYGYYCTKGSSNGSSTTSTIPSSGTYKGYICPGVDSGSYNTDRRNQYYNGCYTSTATGATKTVSTGSYATCNGYANCSCSGNNSKKTCTAAYFQHKWVVNAHSTWGGCIMDRDQDYDIANTAPGSGSTLFPAVNVANCLPATITTLGYDWTSLSSQIDNMSPNTSTNQAIGVAHGWQTITPGNPYGAPSVPANTARYIILLSDGLNTQDRWWGNGSSEGTTEDGYIDDREKKTCDAAKADGVIIYTIFLDIGGAHGDSAPLQYCATDSSKYFDLTSTSAVVTTFDQIAQQITNVRVSR
jgi:Flp pilus assembly protein TadG